MTTFPTAKIIWLEITDSSSKFLSGIAETMPDRTVVVAEYQRKGRGRQNHSWLSEQGKNLTFSILLKYDGQRCFKASDQQLLTMASSLGVVDFLKQYGIEARIKMPNDIYVEDNKICGMLIENTIAGDRMSRSIVGIGIDINQTSFPEELPNPVSMKLLTGMEYDTKKCLNDILRHLFERFDAIWTEPLTLVRNYEEILWIPKQPETTGSVISSSR